MKLSVNDKVVEEAMKTRLGKFTGGRIQLVEVAVDKARYLDREMELKRLLRD